ncbi:DNA-directed RNA polymerase subunit beta [Perilla frutescens var. hirtella]|uniref:DNA-directed RNA polymerase subunit beta n=1 Tax=Perilla frutescens var. hirtella TaxID=608512 RepID=A0AAD4JLE5_PERFH|nr:DNA-directed RNA polymerase subunit beta [Perilla frutescens var. hirtella]
MVITDCSLVCCSNLWCLISNRKNIKQFVIPPTFAKKKDYSENSTSPKKAVFPLKLLSSRNLIIQSATGVFALGFIDAGYSGDWSRIGVISRGTEELLKSAAFFVVPFCFFLIFFLFKNDGNES